MATITKRKDSPHGRAQVRRLGYEPLSRTFDNKALADPSARHVENEMDRGISIERSVSERTICGDSPRQRSSHAALSNADFSSSANTGYETPLRQQEPLCHRCRQCAGLAQCQVGVRGTGPPRFGRRHRWALGSGAPHGSTETEPVWESFPYYERTMSAAP